MLECPIQRMGAFKKPIKQNIIQCKWQHYQKGFDNVASNCALLIYNFL